MKLSVCHVSRLILGLSLIPFTVMPTKGQTGKTQHSWAEHTLVFTIIYLKMQVFEKAV